MLPPTFKTLKYTVQAAVVGLVTACNAAPASSPPDNTSALVALGGEDPPDLSDEVLDAIQEFAPAIMAAGAGGAAGKRTLSAFHEQMRRVEAATSPQAALQHLVLAVALAKMDPPQPALTDALLKFSWQLESVISWFLPPQNMPEDLFQNIKVLLRNKLGPMPPQMGLELILGVNAERLGLAPELTLPQELLCLGLQLRALGDSLDFPENHTQRVHQALQRIESALARAQVDGLTRAYLLLRIVKLAP